MSEGEKIPEPEDSVSSSTGLGFRAAWRTRGGRLIRVLPGHSAPSPITQELIDAVEQIGNSEESATKEDLP